jgi:hypothetical protein
MVFKYDGARAATGELSAHDAAVAIRGIARATVLTAHAFANNGEVRSRADSFRGGRVYLQAPRRGSFEQLVRVVFESPELGAAFGVGVLSSAFWDFVKWSWGQTLGQNTAPESPQLRARRDRIEPRFEELTSALRRPLEEIHRPIEHEDATEMGLNRPRVGRVLTLNEDTLAFVTQVIVSEEVELVSGNITRFNVLSGYGRLFDDARGETVSFVIHDSLSEASRQWITWSLDQRNRRMPGKLLMHVQRSTGSGHEVVRYVVHDARGVR